jgi:hypothetical protein
MDAAGVVLVDGDGTGDGRWGHGWVRCDRTMIRPPRQLRKGGVGGPRVT